MWQAYKELCRMYWQFTINYGWKILLCIFGIWIIICMISLIKKK